MCCDCTICCIAGKTHCDKAVWTLLLISWGTQFVTSVCSHLWLVQGKTKKEKSPLPISFFNGKWNIAISILEVYQSFPKEPIQHIMGAMGVPCCPCVGLECFCLQLIGLIQIWARLNLMCVNVLEHFWVTEPVLSWNRNGVLCGCISGWKISVDNVRIPD